MPTATAPSVPTAPSVRASEVQTSTASAASLAVGESATSSTSSTRDAPTILRGVEPRDAVEEDEAEDEGEEEVAEETEPREGPGSGVDGGLRYTQDITDEELARRWKDDVLSLGSISVGFADEGRLINAARFPADDGETWTVISPERSFATEETIAYVLAAVKRVKALHPRALPLRINQLSAREGGYIKPHRSHQNGRDIDIGFYYPTAKPIIARAREKVIDVPLNWELVKSLVMLTDVQVILLDRRVQKVLYDYAVSIGEDRAWLDSLFRNGKTSVLQHARRHRDHFHVRFFNPRAQELGRRIVPLLAQRPDENLAMIRVKRGDTLGGIARRYGSSVHAIQKANRMRNTFLRLAQVLKVPMRGPCTRCPLPPLVVVPARRLPPDAPDVVAR